MQVYNKPATNQLIAGVITKGLFKGSKLTAKISYTVPNDGSCTTKGLSKVAFKLIPGTKLVIQEVAPCTSERVTAR